MRKYYVRNKIEQRFYIFFYMLTSLSLFFNTHCLCRNAIVNNLQLFSRNTWNQELVLVFDMIAHREYMIEMYNPFDKLTSGTVFLTSKNLLQCFAVPGFF